MHTLLLPISRNSILLLRPDHQILFPGNFYPFMCWNKKKKKKNVCDEDEKSNEIVATSGSRRKREKGGNKNPRVSLPRFQAIFPGFISKSSGVENSILKEKWRGGGESWMKKKRGVYGVIIQPPPKKASLSPFPAFIISPNGASVQNRSRSWWRCGGFGRWWTNCW